MVTFSVSVTGGKYLRGAEEGFRFSVPIQAVVLAGFSNLQVPNRICTTLLNAFRKLGFYFFIRGGDAKGVDKCFSKAIAGTPLQEKTLVACDFN